MLSNHLMTHPTGKPSAASLRALDALRDLALGYPGAHEEFPWGDRVIKVKGKIFVFLNASEQGVHLGIKLHEAHHFATAMPFVQPMGYGLGKSGWVVATLATGPALPKAMLSAWIDESYRIVAPKKLLAELDAGRGASPKKAAKKAAKKTAKKVAKKVAKKAAKKPSQVKTKTR